MKSMYSPQTTIVINVALIENTHQLLFRKIGFELMIPCDKLISGKCTIIVDIFRNVEMGLRVRNYNLHVEKRGEGSTKKCKPNLVVAQQVLDLPSRSNISRIPSFHLRSAMADSIRFWVGMWPLQSKHSSLFFCRFVYAPKSAVDDRRFSRAGRACFVVVVTGGALSFVSCRAWRSVSFLTKGTLASGIV